MKDIVGGAFVGTGSQNRVKDFLTNLGPGHGSGDAAQQQDYLNRVPGGGSSLYPSIQGGVVSATSVAAQQQYGARGGDVVPQFHANITFAGDVGDTTEAASKVKGVLEDFWYARLRELGAQTGG